MIKWHLEKRKLSELKDYPKNPRQLSKHDAKHLEESLTKFGQIDKIAINLDGTIIGGHQRKKILKKLKVKEVECWVPDRELDEHEMEELCIRLNRNVGEWDWDILSNQWDIPDLVSWGFGADELFGKEVEVIEASEEDEGNKLEPGKDEDAQTKLGDLYELVSGQLCHRIVCGDSTLPDSVSSALNGAEPILMVTDPPYGVEYDASWRELEGKKNGSKAKWAKGKVLNDDNADWTLSYHLFPGSIAYVWHAGTMSTIVAKNLTDCSFEIKYQLIWAKNGGFSRGDYHHYHEPCWYAVKKGHSHNWQGSTKEKTLWEIPVLHRSKENIDERTAHSTQKPIECMARPIRNNTAKGEGVYDPFLGSGTTLIAAEQLGRVCYGIELSPAYVDIIVDRWVKYMQKSGKDYSIKKNGEVYEWERKNR